MTVSELMELLEDCDPEAEVVLARDPEGNGFMPLHELADEMTFDGEDVGHAEDSDGDPCIVLWPG